MQRLVQQRCQLLIGLIAALGFKRTCDWFVQPSAILINLYQKVPAQLFLIAQFLPKIFLK